ncbi:MBL fold metallo-hydrolase [Desulfosporosinus sp.]|uniref:MBL fold metallo-hydrolase n=1 Tax=Desulfosporosinus sp. TaxID=157907 RepID=UPI000E7F10BD|nr:MBL fold metallo-hydrolase [Desulfosporosinus sp.]MBC2721772.1 MBL fold metallo-hydrolase [Desulfosporosinus sp.]MBC2726944.1 MBL fold metallo-hydrolase [Desulfosporosinus sp.]HBV88977.1 MBL fold metallo-hydrolase [Desulfosporosinus sp.]
MIEGRAMGSMGANCYLYACMETKKAVVIDPGADGKSIYRWILEKGFKVEYILLTHGHVDHIGAVDELKELLGDVQVGIHTGDAGMLTDGRKNLSSYFGPGLALNKADLLLSDGQELIVGNQRIKVIATPGHSPGSVCFLCSDGLISGDTLFAGSIGRTDFPGGSMNQLLDGVKKKLLILPDDTRVFPGHGEETSIGEEKRDNPFLD